LQDWVNNGLLAAVIGAVAFAALFLPGMVWQYRRFGRLSFARLLGLAAVCLYAAALLTLDTILQNGVSTEQFTVDCTNYLRSLLLIQQGITKEALIGQRADRFPQEILTGWGAQQLERALYLFLQLFRDLRFSLNPRYELELTVSRLAWLSDYVSPKELKAAFDAAQALLAGIPTAVQSATRALPGNGAPQKGGAASPFLRPAASLR